MKNQKLITRLFTSYVLIAVVAIILIIYFSSRAIEKFYFAQKAAELKARAELVQEIIGGYTIGETDSLHNLCESLGKRTDTRITLINSLGIVIADSKENPGNMDTHSDRPEVIEALERGEGLSRRHSYTLEEDHLYYARLMTEDGKNLIIRVSFPTVALEEALGALKVDLLLIGLIVILIIAGLNFYISRIITKPIEIMETGAKRFAKGKLKMKVPESSVLELGSLAKSLNEMAAQIFDRIRTITQQKNEQIAILSSMTEGVLALDKDGRILSANRAAADMFGYKPKRILNRFLYEMIRHAELNDFVAQVLNSNDTLQCRISVYEPEELILNVIGSRMPAKKGTIAGAVIVFTDLTRIQKLEGVRRDFVANVSHELKTPITSIQGYVETLQNGALTDTKNAERFLEIIAKHAARLGRIIDDLLELSRIEEFSGEDEKVLESTKIEDLFRSTIDNCQELSAERNIQIKTEIDPDLVLKVNTKLMVHALVNLLDNALKYSPQESVIILRAYQKKSSIILEVADEGVGIETEHLERIFERFYRVDRGRSRDIGGTGLGLSIVKHIARINKADLEVESTIGKGSIFRLTFRV
ncbi:MAG: PAS domain-containing protein [Candidatus Marinimicrobia bacterium]|nr:PAS domain-containing protein [Candidatus Neomarinimicrobiota bacterium]